MSITLIRSNTDGVIHGADNDKLTGCRKRLQTMSSTREGEMQDIVDLTCDRCKEYFAKKMIRESNREESRMAKEEKKRFMRAKKQGIVFEATYEEYVINRETEASARRDSKTNTNSQSYPLKADLPENNYPSYQNYNEQPDQQPANTPSFQAPPPVPTVQPQQEIQPQFMSYQPVSEKPEPVNAQIPVSVPPVQPNTKGVDDDFLAQFMVNKTPQPSPGIQPETKPVQPVNDIMSAARSTASDILSQLESEFGSVPAPSKSGSSDASAFYSNQVPLVDAQKSTSTFESVTNEFGTFNIPEKTSAVKSNVNSVNSFDIPEVPVFNSFATKNTTENSSYVNELTASVKNTISSADAVNSFDAINHPNVNTSIFDALDAVQASIGNTDNTVSSFKPVEPAIPKTTEYKSAIPVQPQINAFNDLPPVQPQVNAFNSIPPVQPQVNAFNSIPPVQPQVNSFNSVPPVQPQVNTFNSIPPVQPQVNTFNSVPPVQPQVNAFNSVPPVQPQVNAFNSIPPVQPQVNSFYNVPPVQPNVNEFTAVPPVSQQNPKFKSVVPVQKSNNQQSFVMPEFKQPKSDFTTANIYGSSATQAVQSAKALGVPPVLANQNHSPMVDSIEDALRQLGAGDAVKNDANAAPEKEEIVPNFVAYVPASSKVLHTAPPINDYTASGSKRAMTAREAKKAAKIDAKFKKELMDRGFFQEEVRLQRRGK